MLPLRASIACALALVLGASGAGAQAFTLEQVLSQPFPSGMTAVPGRTGRAAWASLQRGARSIWVADLNTGRATRVANWAQDDGQDLGDLAFSDNGRTIAFVRGQGYNGQRENPNPTSDPRGAEQAVWASVGLRPARRLGVGFGPVPSPDGQWVVFRRDSTLMVASARGTAPARPLFHARGASSDPQWSPDGRLVAFASARGDHGYVGVFDRVANRIKWMAAGVDRDALPRWSPDGKSLVFVRTPGGNAGANIFAPGNGPGYAFWIADPATGQARRLYQAPAGSPGRMRAPTSGESFLWVGTHLAYFTENDGYQHLYSLATNEPNPSPRQLTTGACEAEEPSPTADAAEVYVSSNCGDIDRKHILRVALDGSRPPQMVGGQDVPARTIEYAPAVSGGHLLFLRSDPWRGPAPVLRSIASGTERALIGAPVAPRDFPATALVEPQQVLFNAADGTQIHGQLFVPRDAQHAPAIIFMHGGPMREMLLGWHPRGYYNRAYGMNQYLASRGFVVLSVNYRGGVGYGRAFREPKGLGRAGASEYQDIVAGARYLQALPAVDSTRIGLWGGSYGGYLTAYGMAKNPEIFKAGVDLHGVHDWNSRFSNFAPATTAGGREADSVLAIGRASSPVCCVANIQGPMLLIQGDDDRNVSFSETVTLAQMMRRANKPFELLVFPDEVHDFLRDHSWLAAYHAAADFFDRTLVKGETVGMR